MKEYLDTHRIEFQVYHSDKQDIKQCTLCITEVITIDNVFSFPIRQELTMTVIKSTNSQFTLQVGEESVTLKSSSSSQRDIIYLVIHMLMRKNKLEEKIEGEGMLKSESPMDNIESNDKQIQVQQDNTSYCLMIEYDRLTKEMETSNRHKADMESQLRAMDTTVVDLKHRLAEYERDHQNCKQNTDRLQESQKVQQEQKESINMVTSQLAFYKQEYVQ